MVEIGFNLTDSLLSWCEQNQMYLILDLHAAPGGQGQDAAISDYNPNFPSLWQSIANKDKTVALWKKIAEHYADSEWIGGYDLLNETNWQMTDNISLKNLYLEITDSIRAVDENHIIFIEGNWFANDFTNLTPQWDDNMVYSFHKYWSKNTVEDLLWVTGIRDDNNVPLWLGESGENSNTWFTECITNVENLGIGWAWWPWKKIESISTPLSVVKTPAYENLLDYWKGSGSSVSPETAKATLMDLAEVLKMENCEFHPDVIDAMIRQISSDEAIPYVELSIPGMIYPTDFDMGRKGSAYYDIDYANYHLTTGTYTAWNSGWHYRNDGVDIEKCNDPMSNGYNV